MKYLFSGHVFKRMAERGFSPDTIKNIITVYEPNTQLWTSDFTKRRV